MIRRPICLFLLVAALVWPFGAARAGMSRAEMEALAAKLASELHKACPPAAYDDMAAFKTCSAALAHATFIPFSNEILWGGDQLDLKIKKRKLTKFNPSVYQRMYMPLMTFTGNWSIGHDDKENMETVRLEAYFRNALPSGEYPYPFWHSADKWNAYETMNQLSFYPDDKGSIFVATRGSSGSNEHKGRYAQVQTPAFVKDRWLWTDPDGKQEPEVSLFTARYRAGNPHMRDLDQAYRAFALEMRNASCVSCHNPSNPAEANWLTLLQTPNHAAGEVGRVISEVKSGAMPQDDIGLRKHIDPKLRAAILRTAEAFKAQLATADAWESRHIIPTAVDP